MKNLVVTFILGLFVAGCAPTQPVISDISDSSLEVQTGLGTTDAMVAQEARRGCGLYEKKAVRISQRCLDQYCIRKAILFACK